jgi:putative ATPase
LRDGSYSGAKRLGHGQGYQYAHDGKDHFVPQEYLGVDKTFYEPTEQGVEKKIKERLENWRKQKQAMLGSKAE